MSRFSTEADIENAFVKYAESKGCLALKLAITGRRGFPDRTVFCPNGRVLFIEFKKPGGKSTRGQDAMMCQLREFGFAALIIDSLEDAVDELDDMRLLEEVDELDAKINALQREEPWSADITTDGTRTLHFVDIECPQHVIDELFGDLGVLR